MRAGHVLVAEHASPSAEFDVGGVDDAPCLVGIGNDLEEEPAALLVYGQVAELVDDEKSGLADAREFPVEPVLLLGAAQTHEQSGRGEEAHRDAPLAGEPSDRDGQVALAGADGPVEHEVLASGDEVEVLELRAPPVGGHLQVGPVIAVEGLVGGEAGLFEQAQAFGSLARVEFGREPSFDEVELVLGVASASVPASTLRVRVRLRLIFRMRSLFSVVDARRRRVSGITGSGLTLTVLPLRRPCR